jgi:serine/threonine protein kinase
MLVVAALFFGMRWKAQREKNRPFSFEQEIAELKSRGLISASTKDTGPREISRKCIKILAKIGEGAFGKVYKALIDEMSTRGVPEYTVAIKTLSNSPTSAEIKVFMREAALMAPLHHPNVLALIGVCTAGEPRMIALQYCDLGSLLSFLRTHTGFQALQLNSKYSVMLDVAEGMEYLAKKRLVHRDLAARNVLVNADCVCKVGG